MYLDFCKAFDHVPHSPLLSKLLGKGIRGSLYNWIREFLSNKSSKAKLSVVQN